MQSMEMACFFRRCVKSLSRVGWPERITELSKENGLAETLRSKVRPVPLLPEKRRLEAGGARAQFPNSSW